MSSTICKTVTADAAADFTTLVAILSSMVKMQEVVSTCAKIILPTVKYAYCDLLNQFLTEMRRIPASAIPAISTEDPLDEEPAMERVLQHCMNALGIRCKDADRYTVDTIDDILNRVRYGGWTTLYEYQRADRWNEPAPYRVCAEDIPKEELPTAKEIDEYERWANDAATLLHGSADYISGAEDGMYMTDDDRIAMYVDNFGEHWR